MCTSSSTNPFTYIYRKGEDFIFYAGKEVLLAFVIFFSLVLLYQYSYGQNKKMSSKPGLRSKSRRTRHRREAESPGPILKGTVSDVSNEDEPEVIIVGAGVLGAAFATVLARDGRRVTVIERDMKEPDQFAGEVLQPGGYQLLKALGLGDAMEGFDAAPLHGYQVHDLDNKDRIMLPLPLTENKQVKDGRSFLHGRFAMGLRKVAMAEPKVTFIEGTVTRLLEEDGCVIGVLYKNKETENVKELHAPLTLVADGLFSNLRRSLISRKPIVTSHFTGMIIKTPPQWKSRILETFLFDTVVLFFYQLSSTETRVLIDIIGGLPRNMNDFLMQSIFPHVPEVLKEPFLTAVQNERLRTIPARYLPASTVNKPGVLILGEAYNIRHPLTGGGMTVILNDIKIWRRLLQDIPDLYDDELIFQAKQKFYGLRKKSCSFVVNVLAEVLHDLYTTTDDIQLRLRKALFYYCNLSEECALGPTLLWSVLSPKPISLIRILLTVIMYAMYLSIKSEPWYAKPRGAFKSAIILYRSFTVLIPLMYGEIKQHAY